MTSLEPPKPAMGMSMGLFSPHPIKRVAPTQEYELAVDAESKATHIKIFSLRRPHMRAFHAAWGSFFLCFLGWFALAPLMPVVRVSLGLCANGGWDVLDDPRQCVCDSACKAAIGSSNMVSVIGTVFMRFLMGATVEMYGPRVSQTLIMTGFAIPVALAGLATSVAGFNAVRFFIGGIGAAFVITQYWTSVFFAHPVIGAATATTAGWGNLGGGVTQLLMPVVLAWFVPLGYDLAWRLAVVVPAVMLILFGIVVYTTTDDVPEGKFKELYSSGTRKRVHPAKLYMRALRDPRVYLLFAIYGGSFGTELTMNNILALYFFEYFQLDLRTAGLAASLFGLMNIFARSLGGILSDVANKHFSHRGRHWVLFATQLAEGVLLLGFSRMRSTQFPAAMVLLVLFSTFVQMAEGAEFAIVPSIGRAMQALGPVGGIVGSGGNIGALCFALLHRSFADHPDPRTPFFIHGFCVLGTALLVPFVHYNQFGSMFLPPSEAEAAPQPPPPKAVMPAAADAEAAPGGGAGGAGKEDDGEDTPVEEVQLGTMTIAVPPKPQ